jgi:hypothetical protein
MSLVLSEPLPRHTILACFHCRYALIDENADMVCASPEVSGMQVRNKLPLCSEARDPHGPCGIEARFLTLKGESK